MSDRVYSAINSRLPLWARYEGYGTYGLAGMLFTAFMAIAASLSALYWTTTAFGIFAVVTIIGASLTGYARSAAKLRVECSNCGRPAKGNDICPYCESRTYLQGDTQ